MSGRIRTYAELSGTDGSDLPGQLAEQAARVARRLAGVARLVAVASGKGGVGKSFTAAAIAVAAAERGLRVGLLDADLGSPTARRLLGVPRVSLEVGSGSVEPATAGTGVALMSTDLLLGDGAPLEWSGPDGDRFVWRGAQERAALREFLSDVAWGRRDLLLVDLPPGSDRLLDLAELVPRLDGALAITLPSPASGAAVERAMARAAGRGLPLLGVVENMAGYACPGCGRVGPLFPGDEGARLARAFGVPLLGRVPLDPAAGERAERGEPGRALAETAAGAALSRLAERLVEALDLTEGERGRGLGDEPA